MKTYKVIFQFEDLEIEVDAENPEKAEVIAAEMIETGDVEIYNVIKRLIDDSDDFDDFDDTPDYDEEEDYE